MRLNIHEHDLVLMRADNHFMKCMTCNAVYCVLCGRRIAPIITRVDHGVGKYTKSRSQQKRKKELMTKLTLGTMN
jgi:hypothetical protein